MGLIDTLGRIPKLLDANLNDLLDKVEDPVKMMNQLLIDARKDLADTKKALAELMADADAAQHKLDENQAEIDKYMNAARNAAKQGQEADAKTLLAKKQQAESIRPQLQENKDVLDENVTTLREAYDELADKISELEREKSAAEGKMAAAKGQERVNKTISSSKGTKATEAFDRYAQKADKRLATARAAARLDKEGSSVESLADKYGAAGNSASVDEEYNKLMAELNN